MKNKDMRLATVKATGDRYVVIHFNIRAGKVTCMGECISFRTTRQHTLEAQLANGASTKHEARKTFAIADVTLAASSMTGRLAKELLEQTKRNRLVDADLVASVRIALADYGADLTVAELTEFFNDSGEAPVTEAQVAAALRHCK